ncbi:N-acetylgalactosamine 6-sulfate sulfatase (GALNS) [Rhodopirellula sp. SWK7]|nr:N-acetylgalactosamine 6-sulfate sulfatase (GALNS) [Rhodopirellula sp. SWK7]
MNLDLTLRTNAVSSPPQFQKWVSALDSPSKRWVSPPMRFLLFAWIGFGVAWVGPSVDAADRPNVVFILADDLGYGELGCFGQEHIQTPCIDRIASEGMRFTQAYAGATVCAPSRCTLMTGLHTGHCFVRGNHEIDPVGQLPMPADTKTLAHLMQNAGYRTGLIGKWGLGFPGSPSTPGIMGFDYFYGYNCQRNAHSYYPEYLWRNDEKVLLEPNTYSHDVLAEEALGFVRRNHESPFLLYLAFTIPHKKLQVPSLGAYADKPWSENEKICAAMISRMDSDVGRLMDVLKVLKIDEQTLVFFTSDNGAVHQFPRFNHSGPLRGRKRSMYEGGIRSPSIARWPGKIAAGTVSEQVWSFWDMMPTMADLTGQSCVLPTDGVSILPALLGDPIVEHPPIYWEFHEHGFTQAARIGDWKAVRNGVGKPLELYDLNSDVHEDNDLASDHPEIVKMFESYLQSARTHSDVWQVPSAP